LSLIESFGDHIDVLAYHARTLQLLGIVYSTLSLYSKAVLVYQKLLSILDSYEIPNIDRFYVFERLADSLVAAQRFGQAKVFLNALVENRKTVHWLLQYSRVWISEKDFSKAKLALQEAYELSPSLSVGTCEVLSKLAWVEMQLLEYDQALLHFANCTNIIKAAGMPASEETLWIHSQLAQLHYAKKSYEEALKIFKTSKLLCEELHIKNAEYGNILLHIGKIKSMQNNLQEALNYFKSADKVLKNIDKQSSVEAVLSILGVYLAQGNTIKAWEVLKEIETQNYSPMVNATAENELGNLLREFGYNSEAMKYYNSSLKKYSVLKGAQSLEVARIQLNIGSLYILQGKYSQAYNHLNIAKDIKLQYFPDNHKEMALVYEEIGKCLTLLGKKYFGGNMIEKARKIYEEHNN
jgi:tetratricopeptide (TPR) repeat protein